MDSAIAPGRLRLAVRTQPAPNRLERIFPTSGFSSLFLAEILTEARGDSKQY
jgi:hypothetical protein